MAAMNQFKEAVICVVQPEIGADNGRTNRLEQNISVFKEIIPGRTGDVSLIKDGIQHFISSLATSTPVTILYLDPPWALGPDPSIYSNPVVIHHFLEINVWQPLRTKQISPLLIVLKLPGKPTAPRIEDWPALHPETRYRQIGFLAPREKYAVYILKRID